VSEEGLEGSECDYINENPYTLNNTVGSTTDSGVRFVDCGCYDNATDASSPSFGDIASCPLFEHDIWDPTSPNVAANYIDICLVSSIDFGYGAGPVANFSHPLPEIIGLQHVPNDGSTSMVLTYLETSCDNKVVDSQGSFAYPLFPGYGKFAGTCPDHGKFVHFCLFYLLVCSCLSA